MTIAPTNTAPELLGLCEVAKAARSTPARIQRLSDAGLLPVAGYLPATPRKASRPLFAASDIELLCNVVETLSRRSVLI